MVYEKRPAQIRKGVSIMKVYEQITDLIGSTPLVKLKN